MEHLDPATGSSSHRPMGFQNFVVVIASIMALPAARANADRSCVAGPKHQLILSEPHGLFLAIDGRVLD
jgi:hypothetical protein